MNNNYILLFINVLCKILTCNDFNFAKEDVFKGGRVEMFYGKFVFTQIMEWNLCHGSAFKLALIDITVITILKNLNVPTISK